ncbi:MAG: MFS transporter [Thermoflexales bacterium]|nr:MFS transporter [Thermoflexales bacterium]
MRITERLGGLPGEFTLKLFYFSFYFALGAYSPFTQLYYREVGLDVAQIGVLATVAGLVMATCGPVWSLIADVFRLRRVLLPLCFSLHLGMLFVIGQVHSFEGLLLIMPINAFFAAPVGPLADSGVVLALGERRERYGAQRLWGSLGWALSNLMMGAIVTAVGVRAIFPAVLLLGAPAVWVTTRLPVGTLAHPDLRQGLRGLLRERAWLVFLLGVLLLGLCIVATTGFVTTWLGEIHGDGQVVGAAFAIGALAEIPVMAFTARLIRRFTARRVLAASSLVYAACGLAQSVTHNPWLGAATQAFRGAGYGLFWTAGVIEAQRLAPRGMNATAQSLFGTALSSAPTLAFTSPAGLIYRDHGAAGLFQLGAGLGVASAMMLLTAGERPNADRRPRTDDRSGYGQG